MSKERRLGRGLEALLGQLPTRNEAASTAPQTHAQETDATASPTPAPSGEPAFWLDGPHGSPGQMASPPHKTPVHTTEAATVSAAAKTQDAQPPAQDPLPRRVDVHRIDSNPSQPRQEFDSTEMRSLSESIAAHGLLQPVVVRQVHDRYQLVAGERRLRAAIQAGWVDVPVSVVEADDRQMAELAIVENLQRKDLNALEKAASFQKYIEQYGCTQEELAGRLKLDRSTVANFIRLLELPEAVQESLRRGKITQGHARAMLPLGDEREQIEFCRRIEREGMNVRQTEAMVQQIIDSIDREPLDAIETPSKRTRGSRNRSEQTVALEQQFRASLGMKVKITHNQRGRGRLVIHFRNHEEFEQLKRQVCGE